MNIRMNKVPKDMRPKIIMQWPPYDNEIDAINDIIASAINDAIKSINERLDKIEKDVKYVKDKIESIQTSSGGSNIGGTKQIT